MNPIMELQLQLHQQMLYHQQQIALRRLRPDDLPNGNTWTGVPAPGGGPPLPPGVKVELRNQKLWRRFHAETTEMIITKLGRRMFPTIELDVTGLEKRASYYVLLEMEPASNRRHKYFNAGSRSTDDCENYRGWTAAGPAEPQPRIDRRIYLHPDSPTFGMHWMQQPLRFNKLKLTNNVVEPRTNVVLTSMHKYCPRIWIIRCDNATDPRDLYSYPSSSFVFGETEFIAVTAYQNENITNLKIENNPFAKGFRETGQSRCKRKLQQTAEERSNHVEDEQQEKSGSNLDVAVQRRKTASSENGSVDDSSVCSCGENYPPLPTANNQNASAKVEDREARQPRLHRPWLDSTPKCSPTSNLPRNDENLLNFPAHHFRLLHPPFAMPQELSRLQFQSIPQSSNRY